MPRGVECFGNIQEDHRAVLMTTESGSNNMLQTVKMGVGGVIRAEASLLRCKLFGKEGAKATMDNAFEEANEDRSERDRPKVGGRRAISSRILQQRHNIR